MTQVLILIPKKALKILMEFNLIDEIDVPNYEKPILNSRYFKLNQEYFDMVFDQK